MTRNPTPQSSLVPAPLSHAANNPPYPLTPSTEGPPSIPPSQPGDMYTPDPNKPPAFLLKTREDAVKQNDGHDSDDSLDDWEKADDEDSEPEDISAPLKISGGQSTTSKQAIPDALRPGPPAGVPIRKPMTPDATGASAGSYASASSGGSIPLKSNNPYLRIQNTGQSNFGTESSTHIWGDMPSASQKYDHVAELPANQTPIDATAPFSQLSLNSNGPSQQGRQSPDQPPLIAVESATPLIAQPRHDSNASSVFDAQAGMAALNELSRTHDLRTNSDATGQAVWQEQQAWAQIQSQSRPQQPPMQQDLLTGDAHQEFQENTQNVWNGQTPVVKRSAPPADEPLISLSAAAPSQAKETPPKQPQQPIDTAVGEPSSQAEVETPGTALKNQKKTEHYQIKNVRWYDERKPGIRTSPVLTQNANGPCPLLALVNALILTTPAIEETALVETLRTREQVSLGLLLDAVFDELMSGRRGDAAHELPDVGELYTFLITLHTGMNVNPMFVQDPSATDGPSALNPSLIVRPGGFENTREMKLYKAFDIPLLHGWLPEGGSEAYVAFERIAKTYEDAQHAQFQEEELNLKLQGSGLSDDEQRLYTDLLAIKEFLERWPTQLTDFGLHTIQKTMQPGQVGILFRNDHFSTLYKDRKTGQLFTLVTDSGYSGHEEIVWESLVDISGQGSELYSGDFRPVGNHDSPGGLQGRPVRSLLDVGDDENNQSWSTIDSRLRNPQVSTSTPDLRPVQTDPSKIEQEDHDLALALQLQEEEEDRHRRSLEERRRRENALSEEAIAQGRRQDRPTPRPGQNPPLIPPRRNNLPVHRPGNPNDPTPPPTYEEAASGPVYHPPQGHPSSPNAPLVPPPGSHGSAYRTNTSTLPPRPVQFTGRRRSSQPTGQVGPMRPGRPGMSPGMSVPGQDGGGKPEKCIVM